MRIVFRQLTILRKLKIDGRILCLTPFSLAPGGGFTYYTSMRPGNYRVYSRPYDAFWCCVGTGMENHGKYGELIYAHTSDRLFVNLFIPSHLDWRERGLSIQQDTKFPAEPKTSMTLTLKQPAQMTIGVRYPSWVSEGGLKIAVNGQRVSVAGKPGSYIDLMLGPGCSVTHAAITALADDNCLVVWCGEENVRFYAMGMGGTSIGAALLHQARLTSRMDTRMEVVRLMYQMWFGDTADDLPSVESLREREGMRVRETYARMNRETSVSVASDQFPMGRRPMRIAPPGSSCRASQSIINRKIILTDRAPCDNIKHAQNKCASFMKLHLTVPKGNSPVTHHQTR